MKISIALFFGLIFLTTERTSEVDYKGLQKPISIFVQRFSPAFAALEDTFEIKSNHSKDIIKTFETQVTSIKSGEPELKIVKLEGFKVRKHKPESVVSVTKKVAAVAKTILDTSFDMSSSTLSSPQKIDLSTAASNSGATARKSKTIEVDGVAFDIGSPEGGMAESTDVASSVGPHLGLKDMVPNFLNLGTLSAAGTASVENGQTFGSVTTNPFVREAKAKAQLMQGQIELTAGAVYPGERFQFYIQRVFDGIVQERGEINPWTGEYSISIKEPKGRLTVELRHDSGALMALGHLAFAKGQADESLIKIYPAENSEHIGQVLSYESFDEFEVAVKEPSQIYIDGDDTIDQTDAEGRIANSLNLASGSQMVVSASHKGYWNSLQIAEAGQPLKTVMHSDKHMKSFLQLIEPYLKKSEINSVIWGRVSHQGRALQNVKVSLHGFEDVQPLYFSFRIPDPNLEATSSDGFFAFVNPPEGLHIIKTNQANLPLESALVRMDHTSLVSLETAPKRNVNVYSYDAFGENQSVPAKISIPGTENSWPVGGSQLAALPFFDTPTNMVMDVQPLDSEFYPTRFFIGRRRASVEVPHFRKSWLSSLIASQKVNVLPRTTSIIGWIEKGTYTVDVYPKTKDTRVIYFNKEGEVVEFLTDGGGYVATNVPPGVITSTLRNTETSKMIKRLSMSEPHRLSVNYINDLD